MLVSNNYTNLRNEKKPKKQEYWTRESIHIIFHCEILHLVYGSQLDCQT
jgi:hypothetical protein